MKKYILISIILLLIILFSVNVHVLVLEHHQQNKNLMIFKIKPDDEFIVKWIHSVELTPIEEQNKIVYYGID